MKVLVINSGSSSLKYQLIDMDDEKVENIEKIMVKGIGKTKYKKPNGCYSRGDYFEILNEIGLDFIMIAHQKKTVSSQQKANNNDVMSLGEEIFNQLVFMDYFDAFEFRNKKNDVYNKGKKMNYISSFIVGGLLCVIAQILLDRTSLTPARILSLAGPTSISCSSRRMWGYSWRKAS